ncbi:MAG: cytochrome c biogenesis protein CcsA [Saprospiraceae bacterium]
MKGLWWKVLALVLMLYVVIAGLLVPLKPGIQSVEPVQLTAGQQQTIKVEGYNTHFEEGTTVRAWLRLGKPRAEGEGGSDTALVSTSIQVLSPQDLSVTFDLPAYLPTSDGAARASLIIDNPADGAFVLPGAIIIKQAEMLAGPPSPSGWDAQIGSLSASTGISFPFRGLLGETIRNTYFHVSLWFALMILMLSAAVYAVRYLISGNDEFDRRSEALTKIGLAFGLLGLVTGMVWANFTWGKAWSGDVKQNMTAIALLIYLAYFVLRASVASDQQASRIGAAYNVFAFAMLIPLLYIIPRMRASLHPGAGGNPGFGGEDLDSTMRMVFYPGIIGFTLVGLWLAQLSWRTARLKRSIQEQLLS